MCLGQRGLRRPEFIQWALVLAGCSFGWEGTVTRPVDLQEARSELGLDFTKTDMH